MHNTTTTTFTVTSQQRTTTATTAITTLTMKESRVRLRKVKAEWKTVTFWRDAIAEFLATFVLQLVQCSLPLNWDKESYELGTAVQTALGMGFVVTINAWSLGDFGGCHMNPAVTFSMVIQKKVTVARALVYLVVQCAGATSGAAFVAMTVPKSKRQSLAATTLHPDVAPWQGVLLETWITGLLVLTVLGATNAKRKANLYMHTVPIGLAVCVGILCQFSSTGGSMNPARSLGPAVVMGIWDNHWVYWAGPLCGSLVATGIYSFFLDRIKDSEGDDASDDREGGRSPSLPLLETIETFC